MPRKRRSLAIVLTASALVAVLGLAHWLFGPDDPRYAEDRALKEAVGSAGPRGSFEVDAAALEIAHDATIHSGSRSDGAPASRALELSGAAGTTPAKKLAIVAEASGHLWVETRAALRQGSGLNVLGGESVRVGRPGFGPPSTGPIVDLGPVTAREAVDLTVEVELPSALSPGTYDTQLSWCVAPSRPARVDEHPTPMRIEVLP